MEAAAIKVAVRVRPLSSKEQTEGSQTGLVVCPENASVVLGMGRTEKPFSYDYVFGTTSSNSGVYESAVAPLLVKALDGYNVTVFAYGQVRDPALGARPFRASLSCVCHADGKREDIHDGRGHELTGARPFRCPRRRPPCLVAGSRQRR